MSSETITRNDLKAVLESVLPTPSLVDFFYPIGSYYETSDTTFDPNESWGGTWVQETAGQVHVSAGTGYAVSGANTNTSDGGEVTHTLTVNEMPAHQHSVTLANQGTMYSAIPFTYGTNNGGRVAGDFVSSEGGGQAHNNMQSYIVVNRWHRTA